MHTFGWNRLSVLLIGAWNFSGLTISFEAETRIETKDIVIIANQRKLNFVKFRKA